MILYGGKNYCNGYEEYLKDARMDLVPLDDIKKYCVNDVVSTETLTENLQEKNMKKFDKFIVSGPVTVGKINGKDIKIRLHDGDESDPEKAILTLFAKSFFPNNSQYLKWMNEQMDLMRNAISAEETRLKKKGEKKPKKSNVAKAVAYGEVLSRLVDETHSTSKPEPK